MFLMFQDMAKRRHLKLMSGVSENALRTGMKRTGIALAGLCAAHTASMMGIEGMSLSDSLWLTFTTATTVGYGDLSAKTDLGRLATGLFMYGGGIAALAQMASLYFEHRQSKFQKLLDGKWRWNMDNHIVILNSPKHSPLRYFRNFVSELRKSSSDEAQKPILIVSPNLESGICEELSNKQVAHVNYTPTEREARENSSLDQASTIIVLSPDEHDSDSDGIVFDLVARAREINPSARIIAEAIDPENKSRLMKVGADHVIRPIRSYPEMLLRTITAPGAEEVIENLFDVDGEECVRYDVDLRGEWGQIQANMIVGDIGTPLAYLSDDGKVVTNQRPGETVSLRAVFVVAREGNIKKSSEVAQQMGALGFATNQALPAAGMHA